MKSFVFGWVALFTLALQVGCCGIQVVDRYGSSGGAGCGVGCDGIGLRERIATRFASTHCTSGCGEVYWDEQINEPPICDPCGCDNEFTGRYLLRKMSRCIERFRELWGFQYYRAIAPPVAQVTTVQAAVLAAILTIQELSSPTVATNTARKKSTQSRQRRANPLVPMAPCNQPQRNQRCNQHLLLHPLRMKTHATDQLPPRCQPAMLQLSPLA